MNVTTSAKGLMTITFVHPGELGERAYLAAMQELRNWCKQMKGAHVHIVTQDVDGAKVPDGKRIQGTIAYIDVTDNGNDILVLDDVIICNYGIEARHRSQSKLDLRCVETVTHNPNWCAPGAKPVHLQTACGC